MHRTDKITNSNQTNQIKLVAKVKVALSFSLQVVSMLMPILQNYLQ